MSPQHHIIRKKILKFVICSIDCEQSLFFFRFIEGSASPDSRLRSRAWSFASLARFVPRGRCPQSVCCKRSKSLWQNPLSYKRRVDRWLVFAASMAWVPKICSLPKAAETQELTASSTSYMYINTVDLHRSKPLISLVPYNLHFLRFQGQRHCYVTIPIVFPANQKQSFK